MNLHDFSTEWFCTNTLLVSTPSSYNWRQLLLINEPEAQVHVAGKSTCLLMMKTFANYLKKEDIIYTPWDTTSDGGLNYTENLKFYLGYKYTSEYIFVLSEYLYCGVKVSNFTQWIIVVTIRIYILLTKRCFRYILSI